MRIILFFIHGLEDGTIPAACSEKLHKSYRGPKRLRLEVGAGHGGTASMDPGRWGKEVREFFVEAARG